MLLTLGNLCLWGGGGGGGASSLFGKDRQFNKIYSYDTKHSNLLNSTESNFA